MEERGAFHPKLDEGRLHSGQHTGNSPEHDISDRSPMGAALNVQLGDDAVFDQADAGFANITVDNQSVSSHGHRIGLCVPTTPDSNASMLLDRSRMRLGEAGTRCAHAGVVMDAENLFTSSARK